MRLASSAPAGGGRQQTLQQALERRALALAEPRQKRRQGGLARRQEPFGLARALLGEVQAHRAPVGGIGLAGDEALGLEALDDPHPARVAEAQHAAQRVDRGAVEGRAAR